MAKISFIPCPLKAAGTDENGPPKQFEKLWTGLGLSEPPLYERCGITCKEIPRLKKNFVESIGCAQQGETQNSFQFHSDVSEHDRFEKQRGRKTQQIERLGFSKQFHLPIGKGKNYNWGDEKVFAMAKGDLGKLENFSVRTSYDNENWSWASRYQSSISPSTDDLNERDWQITVSDHGGDAKSKSKAASFYGGLTATEIPTLTAFGNGFAPDQSSEATAASLIGGGHKLYEYPQRSWFHLSAKKPKISSDGAETAYDIISRYEALRHGADGTGTARPDIWESLYQEKQNANHTQKPRNPQSQLVFPPGDSDLKTIPSLPDWRSESR